MFMNNGEKIKNLIKEYSSRIRECRGKNIEIELLYFLYECEVDTDKPLSNARKSKPVSTTNVKYVPPRRTI